MRYEGRGARAGRVHLRFVEVEHGVDADVRLGPAAQDQRLDVVELQRDGVSAEARCDVVR